MNIRRNALASLGGLVSVAGGLAVSASCSSSPAICRGQECTSLPDVQSSDQGPNNNNDGDATPDVPVPPGCDVNAEAKDSLPCVVNEYGIFVDGQNGSETAAGTKAEPVKSITTALTKLEGKPRIYVCDPGTTYEESVKLTQPISIYGGFACTSWTYTGGKPKIEPKDPGVYALHIDKVASGTLKLTDLSFTAKAGTTAGMSSIAGFVASSSNVEMKRIELTANAGFAGKSPTKAATGTVMMSMPTAGTLNGNGGGAVMGGLSQTCICVGGGTSKGGGGGNQGSAGEAGETGTLGQANTTADCMGGINGRTGSNGNGATPAAGAAKTGALTASGWLPEAGKTGGFGGVGQGGGGGAGVGGGGGGGGCGACGGAGGEGGGGGGASVALMSFESTIELDASTLKAVGPGAGGAGGPGGDPGLPGAKGPAGAVSACVGGLGGSAGAGGEGGGGAGGVSAAVLFKGTKPTNKGSTLMFGAKGTKGTATNSGVEGEAGEFVMAP